MIIIPTQLKDLSLIDIAPPNISQNNNIHAIISALDPELQAITQDISQVNILPAVSTQSGQVLDALAQHLRAPFYDLTDSDDMKRNQVMQSMQWHMKKGTAASIIQGLKLIDIDAVFSPWWEWDGEPYTFKLVAVIAGDFYKDEGKDRIIQCIERVVQESKAARSQMVALDTQMKFADSMDIYSAVIPLISGNKTIRIDTPECPDDLTLSLDVISLLSGHQELLLEQQQELSCELYQGLFTINYFSEDLGVDLDVMTELLAQFEKRIYARIDSHENTIMKEITDFKKQVTATLEEIKALLKWKEYD